MTEEERAVLDFLLEAEFPGVLAFREQARHARAAGELDGIPDFGLIVDRSRAERAMLEFDVPVAVSANYFTGEEWFGLLLFQGHGWLDAIELAWVADDQPSAFPALSLFDPPEPDFRLVPGTPPPDGWSGPLPGSRRGPWRRLRSRIDGVILSYLARHP